MLQFWHFLCLYIDYIPRHSMYGVFTYIWLICMVNVGKYIILSVFGIVFFSIACRRKARRKTAYAPGVQRTWCLLGTLGDSFGRWVLFYLLWWEQVVFLRGSEFIVCWLVEFLTRFNLAGGLLLMLEMIIHILQ